MRAANEARGEASLKIGEHGLILRCSPDSLARFSTAIGARTMNDVLTRIIGMEPSAMLAVIGCFTVEGDSEAALSAIKGQDYKRICDAGSAVVTAHMSEDHEGGNGKKKDAGQENR